MQQFFSFVDDGSCSDNAVKYSSKLDVPVYVPSGRKPSLYECYDISKYRRFLSQIDRSCLSEDEKFFLRHAATRFIEFDYSNIAELYAHSLPDMQRLMESLALVVIDYGSAIEKGFVQLNKELRKLYEQA